MTEKMRAGYRLVMRPRPIFDIRHVKQALDVSLLGLGIVVFVIGILYSVQTWRFPDKKLSHKRTRMAQGDSLFMVVLGIAIISVGLYL
jgi:hypothetical protein